MTELENIVILVTLPVVLLSLGISVFLMSKIQVIGRAIDEAADESSSDDEGSETESEWWG